MKTRLRNFSVDGLTVQVLTALDGLPESLITIAVTPDTVIDYGDGAQACLLGQLDSRPPQCRGPQLLGFAIDSLPGLQERYGTRWVEAPNMRFVGNWDGQDIAVTLPPQVVAGWSNSEEVLPPAPAGYTLGQLAAVQRELLSVPSDGYGRRVSVAHGWVVVNVGVVDGSAAASIASAVSDPTPIILVGEAEILG